MLRLLSVLGLTLGLWFSSAWAAAPDGQEDICTSAAVIMCENFEARELGVAWIGMSVPIYKNHGWSIDNRTCREVTNVPEGVFDGTKSFVSVFYEGTHMGCGAIFYNYYWANQWFTDLYVRVYTKHSSNYIFSNVANKWGGWTDRDGIAGGGGGHRVRFLQDGTNLTSAVFDIGVGTEGWAQYGTDGCNTAALQPYNNLPGQHCELYPNENMVLQPYVPGEWVCEEFHFKMNSCPTCADGIFEKWVAFGTNPTQTRIMNYPNVIMDARAGDQYNKMGGWVTGTFYNCNAGDADNNLDGYCDSPTLTYHPLMYRWHDNYVVSTQRIGCLNNPVLPGGGSTPPSAPSNLRVTWDILKHWLGLS